MKNILYSSLFIAFILLFQACTTPQYIYDKSSRERQKELSSCRSQNVFSEVMIGVGSVCTAALLDANISYYPADQQFKKLNLVNTTSDTMYVNMLSDVYWDTENYCDFMDIRIPPLLNCKVLVPVEALYNLYFSTTANKNDDELIQINTSDITKIKLYPKLSTEKKSLARH